MAQHPRKDAPTHRAILVLAIQRVHGKFPTETHRETAARIRPALQDPLLAPARQLLRAARVHGKSYTEWTDADWGQWLRTSVMHHHKHESPPDTVLSGLEEQVTALARVLLEPPPPARPPERAESVPRSPKRTTHFFVANVLRKHSTAELLRKCNTAELLTEWLRPLRSIWWWDS